MSICKRNDRYSFRVYVYDHDKGKNRQIERRGFLTKKEAKLAEAKFLSDYEMNNSIKKHVLSFEKVFDYYFTQKSKQWKDLNREAGSIIINKQVTNKTKNKKAIEINPKTSSSVREVYYPIAHIEHLIKKYENECNVKKCDLRDFYIFGCKIPLAETTIRRKNDLYASKSGLHRIKIHDFRHSYITMCYNKNLDVLTTKDQVGHSSIKTTLDIYTTLDHKQRQLNIKKAFMAVDEK